MPTYASLITVTDEGRTKDAEEVRSRRERGLELIDEHGGDVRAHYYGIGPYDIVGVFEFPDTESAVKAQVAYERLGLATAESFEVFSPDEWDAALEGALE